MTGSLGEIEPTAMMGSLTSKTMKPIIIITTTAASSTIPTVMHIAFVGLDLDNDGLTNFDFAKAVVISSIVERKRSPCFDVVISSTVDTENSAYPLSVQLLIFDMDPRLLTCRRVERKDLVGCVRRWRRPKHFREFSVGCDLLFSQKKWVS